MRLQACHVGRDGEPDLAKLEQLEQLEWWDVVPRQPSLPDTRHRFLVDSERPATHVRLDVYPDGGLARMRVHGRLTDAHDHGS